MVAVQRFHGDLEAGITGRASEKDFGATRAARCRGRAELIFGSVLKDQRPLFEWALFFSWFPQHTTFFPFLR